MIIESLAAVGAVAGVVTAICQYKTKKAKTPEQEERQSGRQKTDENQTSIDRFMRDGADGVPDNALETRPGGDDQRKP